MNGAQGEGKGTKSRRGRSGKSASYEREMEQIEYFLYQSTQGVHFMFQNSDIRDVLQHATDEKKFFTADNMHKVQDLLGGWLDRKTFSEKRSYLDSLPSGDYELLIRAYFHLVENTILSHTDLRH